MDLVNASPVASNDCTQGVVGGSDIREARDLRELFDSLYFIES